MSSIRKMVMMLGVLFASSSLLVGCSDDDYPNFGAVVVNSLQTTSNSATAYWTVVSNGSCDGYKVVINEGTRGNLGAEVVNQTFEPKKYNATFTGLKPNTTYVITTQGIPSSSSGYSNADTYEMQFMTAPLVQNIVLGTITYSDVEISDAFGNVSVVKKGSLPVNWTAISVNNCGGYTANLEAWLPADPTKPVADDNKEDWRNQKSETITDPASASVTFSKILDPAVKYRVRVRPNPNNACWYASGEFSVSSEVTAPAAQ